MKKTPLQKAIGDLMKSAADLEAEGISLSIITTDENGKERETFLNKKQESYPLPKDFSMGMSALRCCDNGDLDEDHDCLQSGRPHRRTSHN